MESFLMENSTMKSAGDAQNAQATALTGARVNMAKGDRMTIIVAMGASTGSTVIVNLKQHNAATGGTSKALQISNPYYVKAGAATVFTKVTPGSATDSYDISSTFAGANGYAVFEFLTEELDVNGNFNYASVEMPVSGTAKVIGVTYMVRRTKARPAYLEVI